MASRSDVPKVGFDAILLVVTPLVLMVPFVDSQIVPQPWQLVAVGVAFLANVLCSFFLTRTLPVAKTFGVVGAIALYVSAIPMIFLNQFIALTSTVLLLITAYWLSDYVIPYHFDFDHARARSLRRANIAAMTLPVVTAVALLFTQGSSAMVRNPETHPGFTTYPFILAVVLAVFVTLGFFLHWAVLAKSYWRVVGALIGIAMLTGNGAFSPLDLTPSVAGLSAFLYAGCIYLSLPSLKISNVNEGNHWWEPLLQNPTRVLMIVFLSLCLIGTLLLLLPFSTPGNSISVLDAVFMAVSAVCVSGLTVLDTSRDFTVFGQVCIMLLIQLGGLGIMSIATVGLHVFGRRLTLKQEVLVSSLTGSDQGQLISALTQILKFTFILEGLGTLILTACFMHNGERFLQALFNGMFTSVSAFCNAGFMLLTNSVSNYADQPIVLYTIAILIILGGSAPLTVLAVPDLYKGRPVTVGNKIAIVVTGILLVAGMGIIMAFEWDGVLAGLGFFDKIHNAFFHSASLRTAGFNSLDFSTAAPQTLLMMMLLMFMGGNTGGTSGGLKTATVGVLLLTFWANIRNNQEVVVASRQIHPSTITRAITVLVAGVVMWIGTAMALLISQDIPVDKILFESTAAISTTGMSIGATGMLDSVGKVIIILAMFIGRLGPLSIFMVLGDDVHLASPYAETPKEYISLN